MKALNENDKKEIKDLLLWKTVTKVSNNSLLLSDGTTLTFRGNEGCGGCSSGWYELQELNEVPNAITQVEFEDHPDEFNWESSGGYYRIFVYAENQKIKLAEFEGTDGNGYYGSGYWITVDG